MYLLMNPILLLILIVGIALVLSAFVKSKTKCPPPKIIYKYIPRNTLDVQFGEDNKPSDIYKDLFLKSNIWIGGYNLGDKTTILDELKNKEQEQQKLTPEQEQQVKQQQEQQEQIQKQKLQEQQQKIQEQKQQQIEEYLNN